ncbi:hypothetical protein NDU88_008525 [Pleurodeles waltl]|uniref:Uncharacterized protein n=1 Tax=Pleurodeles waltl TaxID=8319 RepID=A0AAV7RWD0_PLEWA|nr:hypothetical protein NDU88_008525 [Pleurodeles waltl]
MQTPRRGQHWSKRLALCSQYVGIMLDLDSSCQTRSWGRGQDSSDGARLIPSLRRGRLKTDEKRASSGPIEARAGALDLGPALDAAGPPLRPWRVRSCEPGLIDGGGGRRPVPSPEAAALRGAVGHRRSRADGPGAAGDLGRVSLLRRRCRGSRRGPVGPGGTAPRGATERCIWRSGRSPWSCWGRSANVALGPGGALRRWIGGAAPVLGWGRLARLWRGAGDPENGENYGGPCRLGTPWAPLGP